MDKSIRWDEVFRVDDDYFAWEEMDSWARFQMAMESSDMDYIAGWCP